MEKSGVYRNMLKKVYNANIITQANAKNIYVLLSLVLDNDVERDLAFILHSAPIVIINLVMYTNTNYFSILRKECQIKLV